MIAWGGFDLEVSGEGPPQRHRIGIIGVFGSQEFYFSGVSAGAVSDPSEQGAEVATLSDVD
jgi:hypothetical protein